MSHLVNGGYHRQVDIITADIANQLPVDFDEIQWQVFECGKIRQATAKVVDGDVTTDVMQMIDQTAGCST
jgi:hypothetical protein